MEVFILSITDRFQIFRATSKMASKYIALLCDVTTQICVHISRQPSEILSRHQLVFNFCEQKGHQESNVHWLT